MSSVIYTWWQHFILLEGKLEAAGAGLLGKLSKMFALKLIRTCMGAQMSRDTVLRPKRSAATRGLATLRVAAYPGQMARGTMLRGKRNATRGLATLRVAAYPGDGIGQDVTRSAFCVLAECEKKFGSFEIDATWFDWGTTHYEKHGTVVPVDFLDQLKVFFIDCDARCMVQIACCGLACCKVNLFTVCCMSYFTYCMLHRMSVASCVLHCMSRVECRILHVVSHIIMCAARCTSACCMLHAADCILHAVDCMLRHCMLHAVRWAP